MSQLSPIFVQLGDQLVNYRRIGFVRFYPNETDRLDGSKPSPQILIDFCAGSYGTTGGVEGGSVDTACLSFFGEEALRVWEQLKRLAH